MKPSVFSVVEVTLQRLDPVCRTCGKRPGTSAERVPQDILGGGMLQPIILIRARCHGAVEVRRIEVPMNLEGSALTAMIDDVMRPWFLRNWAEYRRLSIRELLERRAP